MLYSFLLALFFFIPLQFALNPSPVIDLASVRLLIPVLFLIWLLISLKNKKVVFPRTIASLFLYSFIFFGLFSFFFTQNQEWFIRKELFILSLFPLYLIIPSIILTKQRFERVISTLVLGASLLAFIGILQFFGQFVFGIKSIYLFWGQYIAPFFLGNSFSTAVLSYPSWLVSIGGKDYIRATSLFPDPHMLAFYVGMLFPWSIALALSTLNHRKLYIVSSILLFICDLLTFSRGGYIGLLGGSAVAFIFFYNLKINKIFVIFIITFFLSLFFLTTPVSERLFSTFNSKDGSNIERLSLWKQAVMFSINKPLGAGLGNYSLSIVPSAQYRDPIYAHMLYLDIAVETGIFSLLAWIFFILATISNYKKGNFPQHYKLAGIASILIFSMHGIFENPLFSVHVFSLLLIITSLSTIKLSYE